MLAVGANGGSLDSYSLVYFSLFFLHVWKTVQYTLKYCLRGPLNKKYLNNQLQDYPFMKLTSMPVIFVNVVADSMNLFLNSRPD